MSAKVGQYVRTTCENGVTVFGTVKEGRVLQREPRGYSRVTPEPITLTEKELAGAEALCPKLVSNGNRSMSFHRCGRPIKDEAAGICNLHLGAIKRVENKREEERQSRQYTANLRARLQGRLDDLGFVKEEHVYLQTGYGDNRPTGNVIIPLALLEKIVNEGSGQMFAPGEGR